MRPPRYVYLVDKAMSACLAAIEIYNKPNFEYREEAFSILMLNAWELLLKARILQENENKIRSIEIWERRRRKDGSLTKREFPKRNRSSNRVTISIVTAANLVMEYDDNSIDNACIKNLILLTEIRDNAIHLHNKTRNLQKRIQEVGTGSIRNFAQAAEKWFNRNLKDYNLFLMPLVFESPFGLMKTVFSESASGPMENLSSLLEHHLKNTPFDPTSTFNVGVEIEMKFVRKPEADGIPVKVAKNEEKAVPIIMTEENALKSYPWSYADLTSRLRQRYPNFKQSKKFHSIKVRLEKDEKLCRVRLLDPNKPKGSKKKFYNPNIMKGFEKLVENENSSAVSDIEFV